ncbi:MAG TPA: tetratricopeptide repeat protein [Anaerolineae bacterium]|nr:tetratricopeptide repeat protein [Anaerolineae bacterium]
MSCLKDLGKRCGMASLLGLTILLLAFQFPEASSPTPTVQPAEHLEAARIHQRNGDYQSAIAAYKAVLASEPNQEQMREARYHLGESYLASGSYELAVDTLKGLLREHRGSDKRYPQVFFLLAQAHQRLGHWTEAIKYYRAYLARRDVIASYVHELIGDCYINLGIYSEAINAYEDALQEAPEAGFQVHLREKIADAYLRQQNYEPAIAQYDAILKIARIGYYRAKIEYLAGMAYLNWGQTDQAHARFLETVNNYPEARYAYLSLVELVNAGVKVDDFQRGLVDYYNGAYQPAIDAFHRHVQADPHGHSGAAHYYAGLAYKAIDSYELARREFDLLIDTHPEDERWDQAWLEKAAVLADRGDYDGAVQVYQTFVRLYPQHELAGEVLWRRAQLAESHHRYDEAARVYLDLQSRYPQWEQADAALFQAGLCYYRQAKERKAVDAWRKLLEDYAQSELRSKALFWLGKAYLRLGETEEAKQSLAEATAVSARDYYALRAEELRRARDGDASPPFAGANILLATDRPAEQEEAEAWLESWANVSGEGSEPGDPDFDLTRDPHFRRGQELLAVGLREEALNEFKALREELADDPLALYQLALACRSMGLYRSSIRCVQRIVHLSPVESVLEGPPFLQRLAYPLYFEDLVIAEAQANNLDPLLLFAVIRQESLFEPYAASWADARGLTQIVPATGEWVATRLGWPEYHPDDLDKPYVNVKFGAWYLAYQIQDFGNVFAALTAYNAGPGNAIRWLSTENESDDDLFVEGITFAESQLYVKRLYEYYFAYNALYR